MKKLFIIAVAGIALPALAVTQQATVQQATVQQAVVQSAGLAPTYPWITPAGWESPAPVELDLSSVPSVIELHDCSPAEVASLIEKAELLKQSSQTVILGWSPASPISGYDPVKVSAAVEAVAPFVDGFAPAWHRSGAHFGPVPDAQLKILISAARRGNPRIALLGELYFGEVYGIGPSAKLSAGTWASAILLIQGEVNRELLNREVIWGVLNHAGLPSDLLVISVVREGVPADSRYPVSIAVDYRD